ncbi:MAG: SAM-dependent methyltransferase, partial [bacterium]|nr:SAM-dependent methyltransferase [bacterium]
MEKSGGSLSFAEYMQEVLYAPGLGYYCAGSTKLGADGDFVTAPEISPLFGHVLARQVAFVLDQLGGGDLLEPGAGSGALAASVLSKLAELNALPDRYLILEVSAELRERQEKYLREEVPQLADRVTWITGIPATFSGVVVANEVADAIPVERFRMDGGNVMQARVIRSGDKLAWQFEPAPEALTAAVAEIESGIGRQLENGYESEVSPGLYHWVGD